MPRITLELIRKKSEHHEGLLADMQELSLHQLNLERIELLSNVCRRLRILYLQNNLIGKMENLNRLKELRYLNLALNNIVCIENIEGCEKLERLDLTVNFVDIDRLEESLQSLQNLDFFEDLTLMGNPCTEFPEYRAVVIAMLPRLKRLDGKDVSITERLAASTNKERLLQALREASKQRREERNVEEDEDNEEAEEAESAGKTNNVGQEVPEVSISTSTSTTTTTSTSTSTSTSNSKSSGPLIEVVDANDEEEEEEEGRAERAKEKKRAAAVRKASEKKQRYTPASRLKMYLDEVEAQKKKYGHFLYVHSMVPPRIPIVYECLRLHLHCIAMLVFMSLSYSIIYPSLCLFTPHHTEMMRRRRVRVSSPLPPTCSRRPTTSSTKR